MSAPTALLFDFGGTLDADGVAWKERFRSILAQPPSDAFDRAYYAADDALVGSIPRDLSFRDTVGRLSRNLVRELGIDEDRAAEIAENFHRTSLAKAEANREILGRLARRFRLGIVSNFYGNLARVCADTGIARHVPVVIDSAVVGFEKPDPRIFQAALDALEVKPEAAVFVGDSIPRDMQGARDLGMPHILVAANGTAACGAAACGAAARGAEACCPEDRVVGSVSELLDMYP